MQICRLVTFRLMLQKPSFPDGLWTKHTHQDSVNTKKLNFTLILNSITWSKTSAEFFCWRKSWRQKRAQISSKWRQLPRSTDKSGTLNLLMLISSRHQSKTPAVSHPTTIKCIMMWAWTRSVKPVKMQVQLDYSRVAKVTPWFPQTETGRPHISYIFLSGQTDRGR